MNIRFAKFAVQSIAAAALLCAHAARGDRAPSPDCAKDRYDSRCLWTSYGEPEVNSAQTKGDSVIRVDGGFALYRERSVMVEFRHDALGDNWMTFRNPSSATGAIRIPIAEKVWQTMLAHLRVFQTEQAAFQVRRAKEVNEGKNTIICTDGAAVSVDSSIDGTVLHHEADSCENDSVYTFLDSIRTLAYSQIPYCAENQLHSPELCLSLDGDKFAAAEVLARFLAIDSGDCEKNAPSRSVLPLLAEDVEFRAAGFPVAKGRVAVAGAWQSFICSMGTGAIGPWPKSVEGSHDEVRLIGSISATTTRPLPNSNMNADYEILAESTLLWRKDQTGIFRIVDWTVGNKVERNLR